MDYSNVPAYLSTVHSTQLGYLNTAIQAATNPYTGLLAYDPDSDISDMAAEVLLFKGYANEVDWEAIYPRIYALAVSLVDGYIGGGTYVSARTAAHAAILDTDLAAKVYPKFEAGMRDINAVMTSAFAIGRAILSLDRNDKVDRFTADIELQMARDRNTMINQAASELLRIFLQRTEFQRAIAAMSLDYGRLKIAAKSDEATEQKSLDADEAKWEMAKYQYMSNMLAALNGGVSSSAMPGSEGSKTSRILGGALSGASAGAMIGAAITGGSNEGSGYGAILGGLAGAFLS
jgi:hypothetical protein